MDPELQIRPHMGWAEKNHLLWLVARILPAFFPLRALCCFIIRLLSTMTPRSITAEIFSIQSVLSLYWNMGMFVPRGRTSQFIFLNSMSCLSSHFSNLLKSLWRIYNHLVYQTLLIFLSSEKLLNFCSIIHVINKDFIESQSRRISQFWRDLQGSSNPTLGSTQHSPKIRWHIWELFSWHLLNSVSLGPWPLPWGAHSSAQPSSSEEPFPNI